MRMLLGFELGLVFFVALAWAPSRSDVPATHEIDAVFSNVTRPKAPGLAVLVRKDGRTMFERGYGLRDLRTHATIDPATNFRLASCTKQFTAMAIMLLVHDRKLAYDTRITDVFPDFPAYGKSITIRNLLNHTSGLLDYEDLMTQPPPNTPPDQQRQISDGEVLALLEKQTTTKFPPGTKWAYSNSGYVLLGDIVAKVSGESFPQFLHNRIFAPLGMSSSIAYVKGENEVAHRAFGYSKSATGWDKTDQDATSATLGDGGVYSSLNDLAKWDEALAHHTLLSATEMQPALTPVAVPSSGPVGPDNEPASYGFGWFLNTYKGHPRMWHYGETIGFRSSIQRFTHDHLTIIVLCNRSDLNPSHFAARVADLFFATGTQAQ
ncbi:MAG TPA: serine hydrolase domain-containing protein [Candidatus Acidoferrum sp.]|nr:serine hydrolase domain-containing protein [Candidatus Acidoferrum sp.]